MEHGAWSMEHRATSHTMHTSCCHSAIQPSPPHAPRSHDPTIPLHSLISFLAPPPTTLSHLVHLFPQSQSIHVILLTTKALLSSPDTHNHTARPAVSAPTLVRTSPHPSAPVRTTVINAAGDTTT
ncbi:hypothetical protein CC85DRAFT_90055 [Cutaneotrichosporon oleaginosum]|uniref:Uncharacterized protein n=1 Tax=Cutaneotrichosporon oleaginosum TaxID=879819 RepID=A0A0J1BD41_9TREE|nr:uncharacterized protein CC85DRAFT_90055 [Cutaneotrichosporon oleaginosum]KLT45964.1 hypothetical protein CC85DRAFT_90055 [Cutaneotrichosporon oleaginosum]TXT06659.1 hypothetical protein COLE_05990 [Cutaneotrichosporon oleaginosum]